MGIVVDVVGDTDALMNSFVKAVFDGIGPTLTTTLSSLGLLSLLFVALNHIFQFRTINYSVYLHWFIRYILIYTFVTIWANFELFYNFIADVPNEYTAAMLNAVSGGGGAAGGTGDALTTTYENIDKFKDVIFKIAGDIVKGFKPLSVTSWKYLITGLLVYILGIVFIGMAIVIILIAKLGYVIGMSLAPLALMMLIMEKTRGYFESWLRFTIGFAVVPLLLGVMMAVIIYIASNLTRGDDIFKGYLPFVLVTLAGLVLMAQIPTLATTLSGASMPQMNGGAMAAAARTFSSPVTKMYSAMNSANNTRRSTMNTVKDMKLVASNARAAGASRSAAASGAVKSMMMSSGARRDLREDRVRARDEKKAAKIKGYELRPRDGSSTRSKPETETSSNSSKPRTASYTPYDVPVHRRET